jgi:diguanylate cyclase (GGDEF)-like protein
MITLSFAILVAVIAILAIQQIRIIFLKKKLGEAVVGTEKRNIQLSYLIKTGQALSSALNKEKLLRVIIETFGEITKSERIPSICALYLIDYNANRFVYTTGFNIDITMLRLTSFGFNDPSFKALKKNSEIIFFDTKEDIKSVFLKSNKLYLSQDLDFSLLIPLIVENEIMGVIVSFLPKFSFEFLKKDHELLRALTGQVSIALGSAVQSELAVVDRLTQVYNHTYFENRLEQEVARCDRYKYPVSVLMIDIDHFKQINDTYGHQQGDMILKEVARIIKSNIRIVDLCARYGGEEFAVILPETDLTSFSERDVKRSPDEVGGALAKAEYLRKVIEKTEMKSQEGFSVKLTISIGIGVKRFPEGVNVSKDDLIKEADRQLYRAKQEGRNRVCHL